MKVSPSTPAADLISLDDAGDLFPKKPAKITLHRWVTRGYKGVTLPSLKICHNRFTTAKAVAWFIRQTSKLDPLTA